MSIFEVHQKALERYRDFIESFIRVADPRLEGFVRRYLREDKELWPEPFLQLSPGYALGPDVDALAQEGLLHPTTARVFRRRDGAPYRLFRHQVEAIRRAREGRSFVLTSGTGSGKSFAYFIPILDLAARRPDLRGPLAVVVYPMNALVNSQLKALEELKAAYESREKRPFPLRFARYTGETGEDDRREIQKDPPHLLLTNYVMLEYLMVRPEDRDLVSPPKSTEPFFLVFDELHTYRGRQGADVALLVRRFRARLPEGRPVVHVGTSATLVAGKRATREERRQAVARFASRFFGHPIPEEDVVEEDLFPVTEGGPPDEEELRPALWAPFPESLSEWRRHPLARFLEWELGLEEEAPGAYRRRTPRTLEEAARLLAERAGLLPQEARKRLEEAIDRLSRLEGEGGRPVFAFKLHQFVSQTRPVYATLEDPAVRDFSSENVLRQKRPFFPLRFCRSCGQDYYHALLTEEGTLLPYPEGLEAGTGKEVYLAHAEGDLDLPEAWYDEGGNLRRTWRDRAPRLVYADPQGRLEAGPAPGAAPFYLQEAPFALCVRCGEHYDRRVGEFRKLTYLGSEGRTSATTALALNLLKEARERLGEGRDKLLSFTDNRQDASLQAGHFNDFVQTALVRSALYQALRAHRVLSALDLAGAVLEASGLDPSHYARNPLLKPGTRAAQEAREAMQELLLFRLYEDLRHEWRFTQPNLEDLGLLRLAYRDLENPRLLEDLRRALPALKGLSDERLREGVRTFLDRLRKRLAVAAPILQEEAFKKLKKRSQEHLSEFWALGEEDAPLRPALLVLPEAQAREENPLPLTPRSALGRLLKELGLTPGDYPVFLEVLQGFGLLLRQGEGYRIPESALLWTLGEAAGNANPFFVQLYGTPPGELLGLEAREHTAQVVAPGERERRERRFRFSEEDRSWLKDERRLPFLVASPTLELGVDIADLDMVHLRNIPPTPANYAQRSGRAGRQGQAGLVVSFAGAFNHHDRYFFQNRQEMVAGAVRAPSLDLTNEALLRAHVQAEWLSATGLSLHQSVTSVLDEDRYPELPLYEEVRRSLHLSEEAKRALLERVRRALAPDWEELKGQGFGEAWLKEVVEEAPQAFDRAFDRWRELYRAAWEEYERASRARVKVANAQERQEMERRRKEAERQLDLLRQTGVAKEEGDFYPYRYLATEGFLPGYGFPTLPITAWVPRGDGEYIQRPRPLALREMAPGSLLYHEGAKWAPARFLQVPGGLEARVASRWLCRACGRVAPEEASRCPGCGALFEGANAERLLLLEFGNVALRRRDRITANEEERLRGGYLLELGYDLEGVPKERRLQAVGEAEGLGGFRMEYLPSARFYLINHGLRRGKAPGFLVDLATGEFLREWGEDREAKDPLAGAKGGRYRLYVHLTQNALFLYPGPRVVEAGEEAVYSLAYALKRGMEAFFQVEESELDLAFLGRGEHLAFVYLEAAEGGLGVLRRLLEDPDLLKEVAASALRVLHFGEGGEDLKPECERACYECLLSYSNQLEAVYLDRHQARPYLEALLWARLEAVSEEPGGKERLEELLSACASGLERRFLLFLHERGCRLPDEAQYRIPQAHTIADFFYRPNVAVYVDGPRHEEKRQRKIDELQREELLDLGYRVVVVPWDEAAWPGLLEAHRDLFACGG
jgi:superfamily II DNA/RNA helicase